MPKLPLSVDDCDDAGHKPQRLLPLLLLQMLLLSPLVWSILHLATAATDSLPAGTAAAVTNASVPSTASASDAFGTCTYCC
jgi:hypothetical protein